MITQRQIQELAIQEQTTDINIAREYLQHLFLSYFYKKPDSDKFLFKGGTALRIVYGSPRYSEDLDFSIPRVDKPVIEKLLIDTFSDLEREGGVGTKVEITDAEPTVGGYIANINLDILGFKTGLKSNIQVKNVESLVPESHLISNTQFVPAYSLVALSKELLVKEKVQALIERHKPRDFFDFYFISRSGSLKKYIPRDDQTKKGVIEALGKVGDAMLETDLKEFLPISYRNIPKTLRGNIQAFLTT